MLNWYDYEVEVRRHSESARAAGRRYEPEFELNAPGSSRRGHTLFSRFRNRLGATLVSWGLRLQDRAAVPLSVNGTYTAGPSRLNTPC